MNFPELDDRDVEIKYKFVHNNSEKEPVRYNIYGISLKEEFFNVLLDSLNKEKVLINEPLSEHIMFRFKLGDGKTFRINNLKWITSRWYT